MSLDQPLKDTIRRLAILELWTDHRPTLEREFEYILAPAERVVTGQYLQSKAL